MSKFEIVDLIVPTKKRAEINAKCLYLIDHPMPQIPADYIANAYTGDGGLHGLKRVDFDNYADFSKAKKEFENGQFLHHTASANGLWTVFDQKIKISWPI